MYSQINIKSKIKDYSVNFVSLNEIYKLIGEDNHLVVVDKNVINFFPEFSFEIIGDSRQRIAFRSGLKSPFL